MTATSATAPIIFKNLRKKQRRKKNENEKDEKK